MAIIGYPEDLIKNQQFSPKINKALAFIIDQANAEAAKSTDGETRRIEVDEGIHALCQTYQTNPDGQFEGHREHIDIQYLARGREIIKLTPLRSAKPLDDYDAAKDLEWFHARSWSSLRLETGMVAILFPEDLHAPGLSITEAEPVNKVVVKIRL